MIDLLSRRREMMGASGALADNYIYYDVFVPTAGATRAVYSGDLADIAEMWMDGVMITPVLSMTFADNGTYSMKVLLNDPSTIPGGALNAAHYRDAILPMCVTSIGNNAFRNYSATNGNLTCKAITPPTLTGDPFFNRHGLNVYVPSDSLSAYQTAWNQMTNIQAII